MEKTLEKQMQGAQAQLMQRASLLMIMGKGGKVDTDLWASIGSFSFVYGDITLKFNEANPFDQDLVDAAIVRMDGMIEAAYKEAQFNIQVVKAWRGE